MTTIETNRMKEAEPVTHKHHIIPKHFGGSDHAWNIAELTAEEHADAHRRLYEAFGRQQDRWAWKYLTWLATQDQKALKEAQRIRASIGGKAGYKVSLGKLTESELSAIGKKGYAASLGKLTKEGLSAAGKKGGAMTKGMRWYNNGEKEARCFPGTEPDGFMRGRLTNQKGGEGNGKTIEKLNHLCYSDSFTQMKGK